MDLNQKIEKCHLFYESAKAFKDKARISDYSVEYFKDASDKYREAADIILNDILINHQLDNSEKVKSKSLVYYYRFEQYDCLYGFEYKNGNYDSAIEIANKGKSSIDKALDTIEQNKMNIDASTMEFLSQMETNWKSSSISICIKQIEPDAKKAMITGDYIVAFDLFNQMLKLQKKQYEYTENAGLEEVYIRIAKGNYIGMSANVNQAMAGLLTAKIHKETFSFDLTKDLLGHLLNSLDLSFKAFEANPEWDKYRAGVEIIQDNIQTLLRANKKNWFEYLVQNSSNPYLKSIMQMTDNYYYKRQSAKLEIEKNKVKQLVVIGGFWFGIFSGLGLFLLQVATSDITWYRFIIFMFCLPLLFIVIGAFILRTTDGFKEENFLKLIELTLKINLKGLKALTNKSGDLGSQL